MDGKTFRLSSGDFLTVAHDNGERATISVGASVAHVTPEEMRDVARYSFEMAGHLDPEGGAPVGANEAGEALVQMQTERDAALAEVARLEGELKATTELLNEAGAKGPEPEKADEAPAIDVVDTSVEGSGEGSIATDDATLPGA